MRRALVIIFALSLSACSGGGAGTPAAGFANQPPVAVNDTTETPAETSKLIDVLVNDVDPDGDDIALTTIQQPTNGVAYIDNGVTTAPGDDTIIYTPDAGFSGQDEIVYEISDGSNGRASGLLTVTVLPPPDPVNTAKADTALTAPNTAMDVDVLANDLWDGSAPLAIASITAPVAGSAIIEDNGTTDAADDYIRYTPSPGFIGTDSFVYQLATGQRASVNITVNPDPSTPVGTTVTGSVTKGSVRAAFVRFYAIDSDGNRIGSPISQTVTDGAGQFGALLPLPRTDLLAVSSGGDFVDETDSQPDPTQRRVIVMAADEELESILPATADYVAINAFTNSILRAAIRTGAPSLFAPQYAALRNEFSTALGFDPVTTAPADPDAPDPTSIVISRQYGMALGGIASSVNKVAVELAQNAMSYSLVSGVIDDLSRCLLDGGNEDGPVRVLVEGAPVALPDNVNLNNEILRYRNNRIAAYQSTPLLQIDMQGCDDSLPPPPPTTGNNSPTAMDIDVASINEGSPLTTLVGTFATTDVDPADSHIYTLVPGIGDTGNSSFVIIGSQLQSNAAFDFETQASYSIRVQTDDTVSTPFERTYTISVNDLNESPTAMSLDLTAIDENQPVATVIGTFNTTDQDPADSHTYTLVSGAGDGGNASFSISGNQLLSSAVFDFETQSSYSIRVQTDDTASTPFERTYTISVNDLNESPTAMSLDLTAIDENEPVATVIGAFSTTDQDPADSHTYTLVSGAGDGGNVSFSISGNQLLSNAVFDFETQASYSIRVQTDDTVSTPFERTYTISVNDLNESPTAMSLDLTAIDENQPVATVIGTFGTTDQDPADSHTYTLVSGAGDGGNASFSISGNQLLSSAVFDFETQSSYSIRVQTDDTVSTPFERTYTISVNDLNESPTAMSLDLTAIDENQPVATVIGTFSTTDQDVADSHTYTLVSGAGDGGNASFSISGNQLLSSAVFDFETQSSYSIRVQTDDTASTPFERTYTISVSDLNESPTAMSLDLTAIDENQPVATVIGTFGTTDQDGADSHSYSLVSGAGDGGNASFSISGNQLLANAVFDFETQSSYSIRVQTDDTASTPFERTYTISVNDLNESPTAMSLDLTAIDENQPVATVIGTFGTTDQDPADSHTYTLVSGAGDGGNASFSISGNQLLSSAVFDFETQSSYSIRVQTDDTASTPFERTYTISVSDLNEAPEPGGDAVLTAIDVPLVVNVLSNDSDPDGDSLTITAVTSPTTAGGIATINDNSTPADANDDFIDYTPPAAYAGNDSFSYTVSDGLISVAAAVTVSVSDLGYVTSVTPADEATLVPVSSNILIVFNQAMNAATLDDTTLVVSLFSNGAPPLPATVSYNSGTSTATIDPVTDFDPGTVYYVVISNLVENALGDKQGFKVKTNFTTTPTPDDTDSDGLTDFEETIIGGCLDIMNPDSDGDGIGDGAEVNANGDPCSDQGQSIWYVDDDGAAGGWPAATPTFGGFTSGTINNPNYVLVAAGTYLDQINYSANCDYLVFVGSQDPAVPGVITSNTDGSPTTVVDMENSRNSEFADCTEVTLRNIHMTGGTGNLGTKGGGIRVSGTTTATLESVWLTNNTTGDQGGGLGVSNFSTAIVRNSVIKDNLVTGGKGGGGVWVGANATLDIAFTLVIDNMATANGGGGLYFDPLSTGYVANTYIADNTTTGNGGGIFVLNNDPAKDTIITVNDSVISGNMASVDGGGIYFNGTGGGASSFNVRHNRIADNLASKGAGIMLEDTGTIVTALNNFIVANNAPMGGAGIYVNSGTPQLRNNTIIHNRTGQPSGAAVAAAGGANPLIRDSIIWDNRAGGRLLSTAVTANDNYTPTVVASDFNLLDVDKIGVSDIDFVNDGVTPGFDAGFYLDQLTSVAVDTGSDTAVFLGLNTAFTAAGGPADAGTVDRGFHHPTAANFPADGYVETGGAATNEITVSDSDSGANAVEVRIRPLITGLPLGTGHLVVATLEGVSTGLAQLADTAGVDPLSDAESVVLADLGNGEYRAFVESEAPAGGPTTIALRIYVDTQILPIAFNIDRIP